MTFLCPCPIPGFPITLSIRPFFAGGREAAMRVFVSAGEPSGDLHGSNLVAALRHLRPGLKISGMGGERMAAAGCELIYPLVQMAMIGVLRVLSSVPKFASIRDLAVRHFIDQRPDVVVLIDFPGFHWHIAKAAKERGIPVVYFIPPQLWAWAGWRVAKLRRLTDRVLCNLPFEERFYQRKHVPVEYVGHPYFDELRQQRLEPDFVSDQQDLPGRIVALLPGSRNTEITLNAPSLLRTAALIHARQSDVRFLVACLRPDHKARIEGMLAGQNLPIQVHAGRTAEIIHLAHSCVAVSGSVGLELLYRLKPTVVVYREHWSALVVAWLLQKCPYISLVNLLAGKMLYPEYLVSKCPAEEIAGHVLGWLQDPYAYAALIAELYTLRTRVAIPGACARAAASILRLLDERAGPRRLAA
jgi:lipid-A-disaccharide synthase